MNTVEYTNHLQVAQVAQSTYGDRYGSCDGVQVQGPVVCNKRVGFVWLIHGDELRVL